jgi:hypothetical protein
LAVQLSFAREAEKRWRYNGIERVFSCGIFAGQEGPESGKLKNLHC